MRFKSLKNSLEHAFVTETFGKDFSKEELPQMAGYVAAFFQALAFYLPLSEQAFDISFWNVGDREELMKRFGELREMVPQADQAMITYVKQFADKLAEKQASLHSFKENNSKTLLDKLLTFKNNGIRFSAIPQQLRSYMDDFIRLEDRLAKTAPLTDEQRERDYRSFLKRKLCSRVPYDAVDSDGTTLIFIAIKYHNKLSSELIYQRPCGFEQRNVFGISAKEYDLSLKRNANPSFKDESLERDILEKDILEEKEEIKEENKTKTNVGT